MSYQPLVGKEVSHFSLGSGTISEVRESGNSVYLTVVFSSKTSQFVFPDAFDKYLATQDEETLLLYKEAVAKRTAKIERNNQTPSVLTPKMPKKSGPIKEKNALPPLKPPGGGWYRYYEDHYPGYVIFQREGFMYSAHGRSADVMGTVMNYEVVESDDGRSFTGGPDLSIIADGFKMNGISYIAVNGGRIEDQFDGKNPFI